MIRKSLDELVTTGNRVTVFFYFAFDEAGQLRPGTRHEAAVVKPGDHIVWAIRPEGELPRGKPWQPPRFRIRNVRRLANLEPDEDIDGSLDAHVHVSHTGITWREHVEEGMELGIASHHGFLAGLVPDSDKERADEERAKRALRLFDRMYDDTPNLELVDEEKLFVGGWNPDEHDFEFGPLVSVPINPALTGHWVWTYEWQFDREDLARVDPHIYVHEGSKR